MSRDCFIAPRATRWSTGLSPLIIMITRWVGYNERRVRSGKKKHGFIPLSGVSQSYLPAYLSSSPALVSSRNPTKCIAQATKSNFSLLSTLLRTTLYPCLEREVARAMRHMPSPLVVRVCKFRRCIVSTGCPLLCFSPPPLLSVSTKDPGQTFIRLGIFIF